VDLYSALKTSLMRWQNYGVSLADMGSHSVICQPTQAP